MDFDIDSGFVQKHLILVRETDRDIAWIKNKARSNKQFRNKVDVSTSLILNDSQLQQVYAWLRSDQNKQKSRLTGLKESPERTKDGKPCTMISGIPNFGYLLRYRTIDAEPELFIQGTITLGIKFFRSA